MLADARFSTGFRCILRHLYGEMVLSLRLGGAFLVAGGMEYTCIR